MQRFFKYDIIGILLFNLEVEMSGISVLHSVLEKLEELRYTALSNDEYFLMRYEYLQEIPGKQLYDTLIKLQDDKFITFKLDEKIYEGTYLNKKGRPIPCSEYFKIKLLDEFFPYYLKIKNELREKQRLEKISKNQAKFNLSKRQQDVLQLYSNGFKTREEIAKELKIKASTIRNYEEEIMRKLEAGTIEQAIKIAAKNDIID